MVLIAESEIPVVDITWTGLADLEASQAIWLRLVALLCHQLTVVVKERTSNFDPPFLACQASSASSVINHFTAML